MLSLFLEFLKHITNNLLEYVSSEATPGDAKLQAIVDIYVLQRRIADYLQHFTDGMVIWRNQTLYPFSTWLGVCKTPIENVYFALQLLGADLNRFIWSFENDELREVGYKFRGYLGIPGVDVLDQWVGIMRVNVENSSYGWKRDEKVSWKKLYLPEFSILLPTVQHATTVSDLSGYPHADILFLSHPRYGGADKEFEKALSYWPMLATPQPINEEGVLGLKKPSYATSLFVREQDKLIESLTETIRQDTAIYRQRLLLLREIILKQIGNAEDLLK